MANDTIVMLLALCIDWRFGEPPARIHPVVWIGRYLSWVGENLPRLPPRQAFWSGVRAWLVGVGIVTSIFQLLTMLLMEFPGYLQIIGLSLLLKPLFAFRLLLDEVAAVETCLSRSLTDGRQRLSHLVSRDTENLTATEVRESALELLAENLSDSLVAPLFWYALLGLPGAAFYRFVNTADAMWGYRGQWEWAGKCAARMDDVLNLLPARLTGLALGFGTRLSQLVREARQTPSPNSGWPMAALALRLGVRLGKPGVYRLNAMGRDAGPEDVGRGLNLVRRTGWLLALGLALFAGYRHA
jgi:adenosylcobinamide-phosphate synthase